MIGVVILAAGQSQRMGTPKPAALLRGKPMIAHVIDAVSTAGLPPPVIVLGHEAKTVTGAIGARLCTPVHSADYAKGQAHSLRAGLAAVPAAWDGVIVALADMPLVSPALFSALAHACSRESIVAPFHGGRRGNPVAWGRALFADLMALEGDTGGRALFERYGKAMVRIDWPDTTIFADADTPGDLAALERTGLRD